MRRSRKELEAAVAHSSGKQKARAYYALGVFHDNNSREKEAIPNYKSALKLGLDVPTKAKTLAWLASSLYKTGKSREGLATCKAATRIANPELSRFLKGLEQRIRSKI
jgi:tetratricopeptide (TPR) repeat protein